VRHNQAFKRTPKTPRFLRNVLRTFYCAKPAPFRAPLNLALDIMTGILRSIFLSTLAVFCSQGFACEPCRDLSSEKRVEEEWNDSDSIIIATVIEVQKFSAICHRKNYDGEIVRFNIPTERVQFRVDRVFKGNIKPGDRFVTETNLLPGRCIDAKSVDNNPEWLRFSKGHEARPEIFKQWLIYNFPMETHELAGCSTLPLEIAVGRGDIDLLESIVGNSSGNPINGHH